MSRLKIRRAMAAAVGVISAIVIVAGPAAAQKYVIKLGHPLPLPRE